MKTIGIIAEFNPFHKGHEHIIREAREHFGAESVIVVMSGDYVQRGEPAVIDKYARTRMALTAGADIVLELPVAFATGSAQYFARGAVSALLHTGVTDGILFGSESGEIPGTEAGNRDSSAADDLHTGNCTPMDERLSPNDLLAAEYIKAIQYFNADITPLTIPRKAVSHTDDLPKDGFASASAIRRMLTGASADITDDPSCISAADRSESIKEFIPSYAPDILRAYLADKKTLSPDRFSDMLFSSLIRERSKGFADYFDIFPDLSDKICGKLEAYKGFTSFIDALKSKDITYSHLSRALLHILLNIKKDDVEILRSKYDYCPWLRILGLNRESTLPSILRSSAGCSIISRLADAKDVLDADASALLEKDIAASDLYCHAADKKGGFVSEYRRGIVVIS